MLGEDYLVERIGTDGDINRAIDLMRRWTARWTRLNGRIDLYMAGVGKKYVFRDAKKIARAAQKTPLVDGTGLKSTLGRVVKHAAEVENCLSQGSAYWWCAPSTESAWEWPSRN